MNCTICAKITALTCVRKWSLNNDWKVGYLRVNNYIYFTEVNSANNLIYTLNLQDMAGKKITLKKLPGKKKPPTLTLKVASSVKPKLKSDTEGVKKASAKKRK